MSFDWQTTPEDAFTALYDAYTAKVHQAVFAIMTARAPEIENWMKENALWQDRTANARQTLWAQAIDGITEVVILLSHGVDYGFWLEVQGAGKWGILNPAIDHWFPIIMADLQRLLK